VPGNFIKILSAAENEILTHIHKPVKKEPSILATTERETMTTGGLSKIGGARQQKTTTVVEADQDYESLENERKKILKQINDLKSEVHKTQEQQKLLIALDQKEKRIELTLKQLSEAKKSNPKPIPNKPTSKEEIIVNYDHDNFIEEEQNKSEEKLSNHEDTANFISNIDTNRNGKEVAEALYDYTHPDAAAPEFFSFRAGDRFVVLLNSPDLQGWTIVLDSRNQKGFVPGNYLQVIPQAEEKNLKKSISGLKMNATKKITSSSKTEKEDKQRSKKIPATPKNDKKTPRK